MTDIDEARTKVRAHLGSDDFELEEFPQGWRVIRPIPKGMMGTPTLAVERSSGNLLSFASGVPPSRVSEGFEQVRGTPVWSRTSQDRTRVMMAEIDEARAKVRAHLGSDDFELDEFPQGWRVIRPLLEGTRGAGTYAIERATGNHASTPPPWCLLPPGEPRPQPVGAAVRCVDGAEFDRSG